MTQIAPKPVFDGVKEWPAAAPAAAVIGHNRPPPEEMVVIEFNEALDAKEGFRAKFAALIERGKEPPECNDDDMAGRLGDFIKMASNAQGFIDDQRMVIKAPHLAATRAIDGVAKNMADQLDDVKRRAKFKLDGYMAELARKRQAEAARIAAEQAEMRRKAEEQAAAERAAAARDGAEAPPRRRRRFLPRWLRRHPFPNMSRRWRAAISAPVSAPRWSGTTRSRAFASCLMPSSRTRRSSKRSMASSRRRSAAAPARSRARPSGPSKRRTSANSQHSKGTRK